MSLTLGQTGTQWQNGLAALERLSLALLIDTKHNGFIGRIQIKPHNIAHLLYKHRVGTQLEGEDKSDLFRTRLRFEVLEVGLSTPTKITLGIPSNV